MHDKSWLYILSCLTLLSMFSLKSLMAFHDTFNDIDMLNNYVAEVRSILKNVFKCQPKL